MADQTTPVLKILRGNVGIGTASPSFQLTVVETGDSVKADFTNNVNANFRIKTSGTAVQIGPSTSSNLEIQTGNTTRLTVDSSGNVGIGTTSPSEKLSIASGDISITTGYGIHAVNGANENGMFFHAAAAGNSGNLLNFKTDGSERMRIDSSGNVGIGTTSPDAKLEIKSDGSAATGAEIRLTHANNDSTDVVSTVNFANNAGSVAMIQGGTTGANNTGYISFFTDNAGTSSEKVRIIADGNVGIGSTSPTTTLHLSHPAVGQSGSAVTSITKAQALDLGLKLSFSGGANSDGNILGGIALGHTGEEYAGLYAIDGGSSAATDLGFFVGDTNGINEVIHIASEGTIQINSPSTSGTRSLTVKLTDNTSGAAVFEQSSNEYLRINTTNGSEKIILGDNGTNPKINFNGEYDFPTADGTSGQVLVTDGSGTLSFSSAGSGTISGSGTDNYIPRFNGTSALENSVIYDDGTNIGLGTTSPTVKLDVRATGGDSTELLRLQSDGDVANGGYHWMTAEIATGQSTDANIIHLIGKAESSKNSGYFGFNYQGDGSDSNFITLGGYSANNLLNIKMDGNVGIGTTSPDSGLTIAKTQTSAHTYTTNHLHLATPTTSNNGGATT